MARAAVRFAAGQATAGVVPASASALAEGVITTMLWTKLKAIAGAGCAVLVLGVGVGVGEGTWVRHEALAQDREKRAESTRAGNKGARAALPSPAEQYQALVQRFDVAMAAYNKLGENAQTQAEREAAYKGHRLPELEFNPQFLALAERYPNDPVAIDSLSWILEKTMRYWDSYHQARGDALERTMEILARDHLANPRLGVVCLKLTLYPSPRRDQFLRAVASRSSDRVVRGRATLALAQYLKNKGEFVASLQKPGSPQEEKTVFEIYGPEYLGQLRASDPAAMLAEADRLFARVSTDFADVALAPPGDQPSRETLADVAARDRRRPPPGNSQTSVPDEPADGFRSIDEAFRSGVKAANEAAEKAQKDAGKTGMDEVSLQAYIRAYPKWTDAGVSMWRLAQAYPRNQAAFNALIWLVEQGPRFFDSRPERDAVLSQVVDVFVRDHLETIAGHLTDRNVAMALSLGEPLPATYRERLLRALFTRCRDRIARGRMGLILARYLMAEAECIERLNRPGAESRAPVGAHLSRSCGCRSTPEGRPPGDWPSG